MMPLLHQRFYFGKYVIDAFFGLIICEINSFSNHKTVFDDIKTIAFSVRVTLIYEASINVF